MAFEFNKNGICTNPNVFFRHELDYCQHTKVSTAQDPISGLWFAASSCSYKSAGSSSGVGRSSAWRVGYSTEIKAAVACMMRVLTQHVETGNRHVVNSPQAVALLQRRVDELTGKLGVQADLFAMAA